MDNKIFYYPEDFREKGSRFFVFKDKLIKENLVCGVILKNKKYALVSGKAMELMGFEYDERGFYVEKQTANNDFLIINCEKWNNHPAFEELLIIPLDEMKSIKNIDSKFVEIDIISNKKKFYYPDDFGVKDCILAPYYKWKWNTEASHYEIKGIILDDIKYMVMHKDDAEFTNYANYLICFEGINKDGSPNNIFLNIQDSIFHPKFEDLRLIPLVGLEGISIEFEEFKIVESQ